jgi:hypothetical protein
LLPPRHEDTKKYEEDRCPQISQTTRIFLEFKSAESAESADLLAAFLLAETRGRTAIGPSPLATFGVRKTLPTKRIRFGRHVKQSFGKVRSQAERGNEVNPSEGGPCRKAPRHSSAPNGFCQMVSAECSSCGRSDSSRDVPVITRRFGDALFWPGGRLALLR